MLLREWSLGNVCKINVPFGNERPARACEGPVNNELEKGYTMPVPSEYQQATQNFYKFLQDARDNADLETTNQAYTMVQGVLQTFRRRLEIKEAILFASVLPVVLRAIFVTDWDIDEPKCQFENRANMTKEVQAIRANHNFAPDTAIRDVASALRKNIDEIAFDQVITKLPEGAVEFWKV